MTHATAWTNLKSMRLSERSLVPKVPSSISMDAPEQADPWNRKQRTVVARSWREGKTEE